MQILKSCNYHRIRMSGSLSFLPPDISFGTRGTIVTVHVEETAAGVQFLQQGHCVGMSIVQGGQTYDFEPIQIGLPGLWGISREVAWTVPYNTMTDSKIYIALWAGTPQRGVNNGATVITSLQEDSNKLMNIATTNPIGTIGNAVSSSVGNIAQAAQGASNTLANLGGVLPLLALGLGAIILLNKTGGKL